MESLPRDPYERQLLEVFRSCDCDGKGLLDNEGLFKLCELLHLEEGRDELMACLQPNGTNSPDNFISFVKFRDALLKLLGGTGGSPEKREPSPAREVSPKYVYGQKKYGRRSRPESTDHDSESEERTNGGADHLPNNNLNNLLSSNIMRSNSYDESTDEDPVCEDIAKNLHVESSELLIVDKESERHGEAELRDAWERLGVGADGFLNRNELAMICAAVGMDTLADQVVAQVFSSLKTDDEGRICFEEFLELFRSKIEDPTQASQFSQYSKSPNIMDLCDFSNSSNRRLFHELQAIKCELEAVTEERDKLKCDLADANRRSTLLAQEIDERHARIEKTGAATIELLEQRHSEEIKFIRKQMAVEKEQLVSTNLKLEESLASHVEQLSKVTQDLTALQKDYENLEKENQMLNVKLTEKDLARREFHEQLECMEALHQRVLELEFANEKANSCQEKINILQAENTELRDRNDELTSQIELLISRNSRRREGSWSAFEYGGGTKRRGKSPDRFPDNRMGKVRRCCTETDLTLHSSQRLCLRKLETSESGLEEDLSTLRASPTPSFDNDSDWEPSTNSDGMEGLRSYIAELEAKLEHYQMEARWIFPSGDAKWGDLENSACWEWSLGGVEEWLSKTNCKDVESISLAEITQSTLVEGRASNVSNVTTPQPSSGYYPDRLEDDSSREVGIQTSGSHCHQVEGELERVRSKIVDILSEKKACSEEVCALKLRLESLMNGISLKTMDCLRCKSSDLVNKVEIEALKEENLSLLNRCAELENSLELLRIEYEKTEDYWENKLDEERKLFELDKEQSDEKFVELESKIQEYAELLAGDQAKKTALPPIEERDFLEKQFTDLEEEYETYRQTIEEEISIKDNEISELKEVLHNFQSSQTEKKDVYSQTESPKTGVKPKIIAGPHKSLETSRKGDNCSNCATKGRTRDKLRAEVDALTHRKQLLMAQIASLQAQPHQIGARLSGVGGNLGVFQSLSNRLRQQEIRCRELQSALKSQQKETETILQKAWERHKIDLTTIQNSLRVTQEKLQVQKKSTMKQLDRLAMADTLVKDLYAENAHLVATVVSLEHRFHSLSESALHNSF